MNTKDYQEVEKALREFDVLFDVDSTNYPLIKSWLRTTLIAQKQSTLEQIKGIVEEVVEEFENRSNDRMFCEDECQNSFWFEEGEEIRYDQEEAGKWLRTTILNRITSEDKGE